MATVEFYKGLRLFSNYQLGLLVSYPIFKEGTVFYMIGIDGSGAFYGVSRDSSGNLQVVAL